ncbi:50S ribosomal protein L4 [bacterium]|nr:50S ribosomal protein L4 [bacterium]
MKVPVLSIDGSKKDEKEIVLSFAKGEYNVGNIAYLIKKHQDAALRQGTHSTKTRGEVSGGGSKPYKQKGTGKARRGSSRTPLRVGGGVSFGPKPRSYNTDLNRKVVKLGYKLVTRSLESKICILEDIKGAPKAKQFVNFVKSTGGANARKVLVVVSDNIADDNLVLSSRNVQGVTCTYSTWIPIESYAKSDLVVFSSTAFGDLEERFLK